MHQGTIRTANIYCGYKVMIIDFNKVRKREFTNLQTMDLIALIPEAKMTTNLASNELIEVFNAQSDDPGYAINTLFILTKHRACV
jgi:hypothetical protein